MIKHLLLTVAATIAFTFSYSQSGRVGIGTSNPEQKLDVAGSAKANDKVIGTRGFVAGTVTADTAKAIFSTDVTNKGFYIPRLTTSQKTILGGTLSGINKGLLVFDTDLNRTDFWDGMAWKAVGDGAGGPPTGNAGGDLTGTYPNPTIANDKVTSNKILDGTITSADLATPAVNATNQIFNTLPVGNGGTGVNTITGAVIGNGSSPVSGVASSSGNQVLRRNNANTAYEFAQVQYSDVAGTPSVLPPTGAAGGDLTGTYPNPTIASNAVTSAKIANGTILAEDLNQMSATNGQVLKWNGSAWAPATDNNGGGTVTNIATGSGLTGGPITGTGTISIATGGITNAMLANSAITVNTSGVGLSATGNPVSLGGAVSINSNATSANTANTIVSRDASGNFSAGLITANLNGQWQRIDDRAIAPNEISSGYAKFGFTSWGNNNTSPYADFLHLRSYTDASGGNDNLIMFRKDQIGMRIYQQAWNSATPYSTYKDVAFTTDLTNSINGTTNYVSKFTSANTIGNSQIFDNGTSVGIGTDGPAGRLDVKGSGNTSATYGFGVRNSSDIYSLVVRDDGYVGIGAIPSNPLTIENYNEWNIVSRSTKNGATYRNHVLMQRADGTSAVTVGYNLGGIAMGGYDGNNYSSGWNGGAEISAFANQTFTSTNRGTYMTFSTTADNTAAIQERMRINADGKVQVNDLVGTGNRPVYADGNGVLKAGVPTTQASGVFSAPTDCNSLVSTNTTEGFESSPNGWSLVGGTGTVQIGTAPADCSGSCLTDNSRTGSGALHLKNCNTNCNNCTYAEKTYNFGIAGGSFSFYYKVGSESGYDYLRVFVDGVQQGEYSGCNNTWTNAAFAVSAGNHTIRFAYRTDGSVISNGSRAMVDDLVITATSVPTPSSCTYAAQKLIRGNINTNATVASGGGFVVTNPSTGIYVVTFVAPFSDSPTITATQIGNGSTLDNVLVYNISSTSATFKTGDGNGNVSNRPFTFIAIGGQ